jgi:predicted DNA-binding protein with PD1-like motif
MILTQPQKRRHFVGSLNSGDELIETLRGLCVDNTVLCGSFTGQGYLRDPTLRVFDGKTGKYRESFKLTGTLQCVSIQGTISLIENQTSIRCHAMGALVTDKTTSPPPTVAGEILSAEVLGFEFTLDTADDIRLYREVDARSGLEAWLHVNFVSGDAPAYRAPTGGNQLTTTLPEPPQVTAGVKSIATESGMAEVREGDFLDHPTLGRCEVTDAEQADRVTIKLESGRLVELHTGLITVEQREVLRNGKRVYAVTVRRRRGGT